MTTRLFLLASFLFSFLQGTLLPVVFSEGFLSLFLINSRSALRVPLALLISGLMFDIIQHQAIGVTSLIFLITGLVSRFLQNHIPISKPSALAALTLAINCVRSFILFDVLFHPAFILSTILAYFCFRFISRPLQSQEIRIYR